jgi:hypothetical protein
MKNSENEGSFLAISLKQSWISIVPLTLFALKIGALTGFVAYLAFSEVSSIHDFISGWLAFYGDTAKMRDYGAAIIFIIASIASFILAYEYVRRLSLVLAEPVLLGFCNALWLANIPAALTIGATLFNTRVDPELIAVSLAAEFVLWMAVSLTFHVTKRKPDLGPKASGRAFSWLLAVLLFAYVVGTSVFSGWLAMLSALTSFDFSPHDLVSIGLAARIVSFGIAAVTCVVFFLFKNGELRESRLQLFFLLAQGILLFGLVKLIGSLAFVNGQIEYLISATPTTMLFLIVLGVVSAIHLLIMAKAVYHGQKKGFHSNLLTPVAVALLAIFIKISPDVPCANLLDEYHIGEYVLPYWSFKEWGMLPYVDLDAARGWINLFMGFIAEEGLGGTYASYAYTCALRFFVISLLFYLLTRPLIGAWGSFFLIVLVHFGGMSEIHILITGFFALLFWAYFLFQPANWLILWVLLGTLAVLIAPGQGGLLVVSTMTLGLTITLKGLGEEPGRLALTVICLLAATGLLFQTSFGDAVVGAVRYALEQAEINSQAHGIPWAYTFTRWGESKGVLFEVARNSWLLVSAGIGISSWIIFRSNVSLEEKSRFLILSTPIIIFGVLFVFRAWCRIGPSWSRPGMASLWFLTLLLPLLIFSVYRRNVPVPGVLFMAILAAIIPPEKWSFVKANTIPSYAANQIIDGSTHGVPSLGRSPFKIERVANYSALKRFADTELAPGEPFLDLTSRNSLSYLLERKPFLPAAVYNLVNSTQQMRVLRALHEAPPLLALADFHNKRHDGGVLGLRAHYLFRFVIENYMPLENSGAVWMRYNPDEMKGQSEENLQLLDRAFMQRSLGLIPSSWGLAWKNLENKTKGQVLLDSKKAFFHDTSITESRALRITGQDPYLIFPVPEGVDSAQWGLLVFDFNCDIDKEVSMQVFWTNEGTAKFTEKASLRFKARSGRVVVPLDIAPRWILGGKSTHIRIDLDDKGLCSKWSISRPFLTQRIFVEKLKELQNGTIHW